MLAETRAELDDFHHASKELEAELESELQRTEKAQEGLKVKAARAEAERDDWKNKFMSLQTTHNTTSTSLQKELDTLRQEYQCLKVQLRDLELGNDDLERNERAVSSSLADMETKYSRALEEKILLEHELLGKASLEEESQRLKDELRDAMVEISILRARVENSSPRSLNSDISSDLTSSHSPRIPPPLEDDLLNTPPPTDIQLDEPDSNLEDPHAITSSITSASPDNLPPPTHPPTYLTTNQSASRTRDRTLRSSALPAATRSSLNSSNIASLSKYQSTASNVSKNKGVQMVSEMRARVRNLEQKIHTRVPRLRMGSLTNKNVNIMTSSTHTAVSGFSSSSSCSSRASTAKTSWESLIQRQSGESRRSAGGALETKVKDASADSSGWVLILEDSQTPSNLEKRRVSTKSDGHDVTLTTTLKPIPSPTLTCKPESHRLNGANLTIRRPPSRLSTGNLSTAASGSSSTHSIRPSTPTHLPLPRSPTYGAGVPGQKRKVISQTFGVPQYHNQSSSLGSTRVHNDSTMLLFTPSRATSTPAPISKQRMVDNSTLPRVPELNSRALGPLSASKLPEALGQTRIGRPTLSGRKYAEKSSLTAKQALSS